MSVENSGTIEMGQLVMEDLAIGVGNTKVPHPAGGEQDGSLINLSQFGLSLVEEWIPASIPAGGTISRNFDLPGAEVFFPVVACFASQAFYESPYLSFHAKVDRQNRVLVSIHNRHTTDTIAPGGGNVHLVALYFPKEI